MAARDVGSYVSRIDITVENGNGNGGGNGNGCGNGDGNGQQPPAPISQTVTISIPGFNYGDPIFDETLADGGTAAATITITNANREGIEN